MRVSQGLLIGPLAATFLLTGCEQRRQPTPTAPGGSPAGIQTIVDVPIDISNVAGQTGTWNYAGQSFTVPPATTLTHVRFNWYTRGQGSAAFGTLYLLDREYLGLPGDLSTSTPGFLARSERIQDGAYLFAADVTLTGGPSGTRYWVYTDTQGSFATSFDADVYSGGELYVTGYHAQPFRKSQASGRMVNGVFVPGPPNVSTDGNFRVQGTPQ